MNLGILSKFLPPKLFQDFTLSFAMTIDVFRGVHPHHCWSVDKTYRLLFDSTKLMANFMEFSKYTYLRMYHYVKSVRIRSYSGPYSVRMRENTRISPNTHY